MARSIWAGVRGGSTAIVGTSHGIAPYPRSRSYSGRFSHQDSLSRPATAAPRVSTTRPAKPSAAGTMLSTVDVEVCCVSPVPSPVMATGVAGSRPAASSPSRTPASSPAATDSAAQSRAAAAARAAKSTVDRSSTSAAARTPVSGTPA